MRFISEPAAYKACVRIGGVFAALFIATVPLQLSYAEGSSYVVVDTQKVLNESIIGKAARSNLQTQITQGQAKLSQMKSDLEKQAADFEKQSSVLSGSALEVKREALSKKQVELQRAAQDLQEDLARKNEVELSKVMEQIRGVVRELAKERGYTFVFERDKQSVVFVSEKIDITPEVVAALDRKKIDL